MSRSITVNIGAKKKKPETGFFFVLAGFILKLAT
jgi:hypothetical protein